MKNIFEIRKAKGVQKISMLTCYDYTTALICSESQIDLLLVGDSLAMTMHGHGTTLQATEDMMILHTMAVAKAAPNKFIIADLPFMSTRKGFGPAMAAIEKLMRAGAHAVKLEGLFGHEEIIRQAVQSGIPVMGHLGLTPQHFHMMGGFRVQGKNHEAAELIDQHALKLEQLGCFSVVLECVPSELARTISQKLSIPTIGIGAGLDVDGQVLVIQDMLGLNPNFKPKFARTYLDGYHVILSAINSFDTDIKNKKFPTQEETF